MHKTQLGRLFGCGMSVILTLALASCQSPTWEVNFYVSTEGDDSLSGRFEHVNNGGNDGPFRTLGRALQAVRSLEKSEDRQILVHIHGGTYRPTRSLNMTAADGGFENAPVVWKNYGDEEVVVSGSKPIASFQRLTDDAELARVSPEFRDNILRVDLVREGITDFGSFSDERSPGLELFFKGQRMPRARYPNEGYIRIDEVPQTGDSLIHKGSFQWTRDGIAVGRHFGAIQFDDERIKGWAPSDDIWMHGYFVWDWRDGFQKVGRIDAGRGLVYPEPPYHSYGFSAGQPVYFFNVLEELDRPGEWVIDTEKGLLYFWPPAPITDGSVTVSVLEDPFFVLNETEYITIEGLVFEETRGSAIEIHGGDNVVIAGNTIRNVGRTAIDVDGGRSHLIQSNDLYDLGAGGMNVDGGNRVGLIPGNHEVVNNHIYRFSQIRKTSVPGIRVTGVKNRVAHNLLHDSPDAGIFFFGNDLLLEYNEIHHIAQESDDVGAFYIGRDYSMRGNVVRFNYVHDIAKPMHVGVMGVYLDDFTSGVTVHGNMFSNAGRCVFMGGGRRNTVTANFFEGCTPAIFLDARGKVRNTEYFDGTLTVLEDRLAAVDASHPPYTDRYPELIDLYDDDPAMPKYNIIRSNVVRGGTFLGLYSGLPLSVLDLSENTIGADVLMQRSAETGVETENFEVFDSTARHIVDSLEALGNSISTTLEEDEMPDGFRSIPVDSIGLMEDEYRRRP